MILLGKLIHVAASYLSCLTIHFRWDMNTDVVTVDRGPSVYQGIDTYLGPTLSMIKPGSQTLEDTRQSKYSADFVRQPAYRTSSSCRETSEGSHKSSWPLYKYICR